MDQKILVGLVEDQVLFRQGIKALLSGWKNMEVVFESDDGFSVIEKLKQAIQIPNVMLVDLSLPPKDKTEFSGKDVTVALQKDFPEVKVIILSGHREENFIAQLIENGAHGYLVKDCDPEEVHEAIVSVYTKGSYINEQALRAIQKKSSSKPSMFAESLTKREMEILELICNQFTSEEISEKLFISVKTVNGHRVNLLEKTGAKNIAGLVIHALKNGIIRLP